VLVGGASVVDPASRVRFTVGTATARWYASRVRVRLGAALAAAVFVMGCVGGALAVASASSRSGAHEAASHGLSVTFPFVQTNPGRQHGPTTTGVEGHGTFSAALGNQASDLALMALATGIPFTEIARGGSYAARFTLGASGTNTGTVVTRFKASGLGSLCFVFTAKGGRFQSGDTFVPTTGKVVVLGGTGAAARWNATATYSLKAITGTSTEKFKFSGTAQGKIATKRSLSPTCKQVAALVRG
jgi:hypothetical protein